MNLDINVVIIDKNREERRKINMDSGRELDKSKLLVNSQRMPIMIKNAYKNHPENLNRSRLNNIPT